MRCGRRSTRRCPNAPRPAGGRGRRCRRHRSHDSFAPHKGAATECWQCSHSPVGVPKSPARHGINNLAAAYLMLSDRDSAVCGPSARGGRLRRARPIEGPPVPRASQGALRQSSNPCGNVTKLQYMVLIWRQPFPRLWLAGPAPHATDPSVSETAESDLQPRHAMVTPIGSSPALCWRVRKGVGVQRTGLPLWQARKSTLTCGLVAAMVGVVACYFVSAGWEADVPQYQRRAASEAACEAAAAEISRLRLQSPIKFVDDCVQPKVTPVSNRPGHLIVTRVVEVQIGRATAKKTYSALMDGRRADAWHMIQVGSAPNELSVVLWPGSLAQTNELAERPSPNSSQSH